MCENICATRLRSCVELVCGIALRAHPAAKDLTSVIRDHSCHTRLFVFEQRDWSCKIGINLTLAHCYHLVRHVFQHRVDCLHVCDHLTKLESDHRLLNQGLTEDVPLRAPLHALFNNHSRVPIASDH